VPIEYPDFTPNEETILKWETHLKSTTSIPVEAQNELRELLRSNLIDQQLQDRIVRLLNPWRADVVHLSDEELIESYAIVNKGNNYWRMPDRGPEVSGLRFDAAHGYYIVPVVKILR
jgi:hypothetical protein